MTVPERSFRAKGPDTIQRLMTVWSRGDRAGGWRALIPPVAGEAIARLYRVDGVDDEIMLWVEGAAADGRLPPAERAEPGTETFTLTLVRDVGVVPPRPTPWLYIVHTDIPADIVDDYNAWYDEEHLPRLVGVPGIERARRYVADGAASPRFLTAYDLSVKDAFESPAGLKARKTPWTEKMRSLFYNTRRKMCAFQAEENAVI